MIFQHRHFHTFLSQIAFSALLALGSGVGTAHAQTSQYAQVNVAGSFNGFETLNPNMTLVDDNLWQADMTITNTSFIFKFATANFAQNWGIWNQPNEDLPQSETGISNGGDINVTNGSDIAEIRFLFNDVSREYSVYLINNIGSNLLYNPSFEVQGSDPARAKYWEFWNPNTHGSYSANAQRQGSNWGYVVKSGEWLGLIGGTWAGSDNGAWWQEAPIEAGLTYEATAWFNIEVGANTWLTADEQQLKLEFYDYDRATQLASFSTDLSSVTNIWAERAVSGLAPAGAAWARLVVYASGVGDNGTFRMDEAGIRATVSKRTEDFNEWIGATVDDCYSRSGWSGCEGRTVSSYTNGSEVIPLSRSGLAFNLTNPTVSNEGSYIRSPRFQDGVGSISFYYRHGDMGDQVESPDEPVHFKVQRSVLGDFWTTIAEVSNVINTTFIKYDVFDFQTLPNYIRIVHSGGSTNGLIIDDISVALPDAQPRTMTFNTWSNATTAANHFHLGWQLNTGRVSSALSIDGLGGQITGNLNDGNYLKTPEFDDGYGTINFFYRLGNDSLYTAGFSLEASTNGTDWTVLDTVTNITSVDWIEYNQFGFEAVPSSLRIRNLSENTVSPNNAATIDEDFSEGAVPPPGWTFEGIGEYSTGGEDGPSLKLAQTDAIVTTPGLVNPTNLKYWAKGQSISPDNTLTIEGYTNGTWGQIGLLSNISNSGTSYEINVATNTEQIRFIYTKNAGGNLALDDVKITGLGFGGSPPPQSLALENVSIGSPVEYRTQNFDTWPNKPSYDSGAVYHQGWTLDELVQVTSEKAQSGQAATLARATGDSGGSGYVVDFEGPGETKTSYALGSVTLSGISWEFNEALIGTLAGDFKTGLRSARIRGRNGSYIEMQGDKPGGLGTISFKYQRYGSDGAQQPWAVEYSTNSGGSWTQIGGNITPTDSEQTFESSVNVEGSIRVRVRLTTTPGTSGNRRFNIDDLVLTDYSAGGGDTVDSAINSPFLAEGIGTVSFYYRHSLDSTPPSESIVTIAIQTSSNGTDWATAAEQVISNTDYELSETYLNLTNHFYARIIATNGVGECIIDNISILKPGNPAVVSIGGYTEPEIPFTNDTVTIFANVNPQNGANNVSVTSYYRIGTSGAFMAVGMQSVGGNIYQATQAIPAQVSGTIVQYYIESWYDGPGASLTRPSSFPTNAPTELAFYGVPRSPRGLVWINEIDYIGDEFDWFGCFCNTEEEFIELAGYSGIDLSNWVVQIITGASNNFETIGYYELTGNTLLANETNDIGFYVLGQQHVDAPPRDMLMTNEAMALNRPGGIRLYNEVGGLVHQIAYDGNIQGMAFPGVKDTDFPTFGNTNSVGLTGAGSFGYEFVWDEAVNGRTPGAINSGQVFGVAAVLDISSTLLNITYIPQSLNPDSVLIVISNSGGSAMSYSIAANVPWLSVSTSSVVALPAGSSHSHLVSADTTGLTGNRAGALTVSGSAVNSPQVITVNLLESSLSDALVHYNFDEGSGSLTLNQGSIGISANGNITDGDWTLEGQGASGKLGDFAYISPTSTAYVKTSGAVTGLNTLAQFTLSGWLRPNSGASGSHRVLGNRASGEGIELTTSADYQNMMLVSSAGGSPTAVATTNGSFPSEQWTFFALTFDSTDGTTEALNLFRGSQSVSIFSSSSQSKGALGASGNSTVSYYVGGNGTNSYDGWMDDVRVYAGVLDNMSLEAVRREGAIRLSGSGEAPVIDEQPESLNVAVSQSAQFTVDATGTPLPSYQWRKFGVDLPGKNSDNLLIGTATSGDAGSYDVVVFNAYGSVTSDVAILIVGGGMTFVLQPVSQTAYEGEDVVFEASATSTNPISYQWRFNTAGIPFQTNTTMILSNVTEASTGTYDVVASDINTSISSTGAVLTVIPFVFDGPAGGGISRPSGAAGIVIKWPSIAGRFYEVLWASNLLDGTHNFISVATNLPATPSINVYTDTVYSAEDHGSYRVVTDPAD